MSRSAPPMPGNDDLGQVRDLYHTHKDAVWNAAVHLTGCAATAEDVVHDVFAALLRTPPARLVAPRAYLLAAVVNRVRDAARRRPGAPDVALDALAGAGTSPELVAIAGERAALVAAALAELPLAQREVCVLHGFEGLSFGAIGELCGISPDTAASRWRYACGKLRQRLTAQGVQS